MCRFFRIKAEDDERVPYVGQLHERDASGTLLGGQRAQEHPWEAIDPKVVQVTFGDEVPKKGWERWPDIIGNSRATGAPWAMLVSARVHDALCEHGIERFKSCPARPAPRSVRLPVDDEVRELIGTDASADRQSNLPPGVEMPVYYAIYPEPGIRYLMLSPEETRKPVPDRQPDPESWSGADLFCVDGLATYSAYGCTRRVIELAREHRWTNFHFRPMEIPLKWAMSWGVDYLGKKWPPDWRPKMTADRSPEEWFDLDAFREYGAEALPLARREAYSDDPRRRFYANFVLHQLIQVGVDIGEELLARKKELEKNIDRIEGTA